MPTLTRPRPAVRWSCPECGLDSGPLGWPAEAQMLAGLHDQLIHNQRPTATVAAR